MNMHHRRIDDRYVMRYSIDVVVDHRADDCLRRWIGDRSIDHQSMISVDFDQERQGYHRCIITSESQSAVHESITFLRSMGLSPSQIYASSSQVIDQEIYDASREAIRAINMSPLSLSHLNDIVGQKASIDILGSDSHNFFKNVRTKATVDTVKTLNRVRSLQVPELELHPEFSVKKDMDEPRRRLMINQALDENRQNLVAINHKADNLRLNFKNPTRFSRIPELIPTNTRTGIHANHQEALLFFSYLNMHNLSIVPQDRKTGGRASSKRQPSPVLYVKGFDPSTVSLAQLTKVFQCFGKVENSMLHTKKEYALIQFSELQGARVSIKELYGISIGGRNLLIHYSEFQELNTRYYSNEKVYFQLKKEVVQIVKGCESQAVTSHVIFKLFALPSKQEVDINPSTMKQLFSLSTLNCVIRESTGLNELKLEFPSTTAAIDFVKDFNYKELDAHGVFGVAVFTTV